MKTSLRQRLENYVNSLNSKIDILTNYKKEAIKREIYTDVINYNASLVNLIITRDEITELLKR